MTQVATIGRGGALAMGLLLASCLASQGGAAPPSAAAAADLAAKGDGSGADLSPALPAATFADLLVQDVCATADERALPDDPYDPCPAGAHRRDLRLGEALPYHRHDQPGPGAPQGYQRHDSFPRPGDGRRYVHPFDFAPFGEFNPDRDGYDVVEADGAMASIIGTRDPVGLAQSFFGPGCALDDSWLLFPTSGFAGGGEQTAQLILVGWERALAPFPGRCPGRYNRALTRWQQRRVDFAGIGGGRVKRLDALIVDHYGGSSVDTADHIERFYFTGIYGLTRWERWERSGTPRPDGCSGATSEAGFVRLDCRDWTQIVSDPTPYPPEAWPTPYADSNRVKNHDFGSASADPWQRLGVSASGDPTNLSIISDSDGSHLATNCAGACTAGQSIYQDVPRGGLAGRFRFGGLLWAEGGSGTVELVVFQRDAKAAIVERHSLSLTVDGSRRRVVSPEFAVNPATDQFRLTLYLNAPNTFHLDDAWLARSDP